MSPVQLQMALAALGWGTRDLAAAAGVSLDTIGRFKRGETLRERTVEAIQRALEAGGIQFVENGAVLTTNSTTTTTAAVQRSSPHVADEARQQARAEFTDKLQDAIHDKNRGQPKPKHRE